MWDRYERCQCTGNVTPSASHLRHHALTITVNDVVFEDVASSTTQ